jgi:UDP-N-acetylmuramoylalanine--D-glutamate ligase
VSAVATERVLANERVVVLGLGASGRAAVEATREAGGEVWVSEAATLGDAAAVPGVRVLDGGHRPEHLEGATLVIASPGIPESAPVLTWALHRGIPVWSELELGARLCGVPFVAVTGTNGKSTTVEMVAAAMRQAGLSARACGNVGYPFSTAALEGFDALAVEASSFQLRFCHEFRPRVSVLLNLAPDHMDWHGSIEAYGAAKARIFARQGAGDVHLGNRDDPHAAAISSKAGCEVRWFRAGPPHAGEVGVVDGRVVASVGAEAVEVGAPAMAAAALLTDSAAAAGACLAFGLPVDAVRRALAAFEPGPHRGRVVAERGGVRFVDNSKATNPHAALAALEGVRDAVLIAGGLAKGVDLSPLASLAPSLVGVVAIGEAAAAVADVFAGLVPVRRAATMDEAVRTAFGLAAPGGSVVLAPACASQDMFRDYRDRGDRFAQAAANLPSTPDVEAEPRRSDA